MTLDYHAARHLAQRTGFGPRSAELHDLIGMSVGDAVRRLLDQTIDVATTPAPGWVDDGPPTPLQRSTMRDELRRRQRARLRELQGWWLSEMIASPSPLTERLVLFWHNHFTSAFREVRAPSLLHRQNALFRRHVLGSFRDLLRAVARDPAMLVYLDTINSTRRHPNENFARELLELFTLGEGHYSEADIREAARAFAGWRVDPWTGRFIVAWRHRDTETKTFLGRSGRFDGNDIIDIVLEQPQVARHIATQLWHELISDDAVESELAPIATAFFESDYDLALLVESLLSTPAFWAPERRGTQIKSPVDLVVGTCRLFDIAPDDRRQLGDITRRLGQDLFNPPNVKGWPGGTRWITSSTLLERTRVMRQVAESDELGASLERAGGLSGWLSPPSRSPARAAAEAASLMLPTEPVRSLGPATGLEAVAHLLTDPAYQLK